MQEIYLVKRQLRDDFVSYDIFIKLIQEANDEAAYEVEHNIFRYLDMREEQFTLHNLLFCPEIELIIKKSVPDSCIYKKEKILLS